MHRDIKPANILMNSNGVVKICDMGFARFAEGNQGHAVLDHTPYVVTRWYRAPGEEAGPCRWA